MEEIDKKDEDKNEIIKFCPECLKRYMPEPIKVGMELVRAENLRDKYVCPECGYEELV